MATRVWMTREEYALYMLTAHWLGVTRWAQKEAGYRCQHVDCRGKRCTATAGLDTHHTKQGYRHLWNERPGDVQVLCRQHHIATHLTDPQKHGCAACGHPVFDTVDEAYLWVVESGCMSFEEAKAKAPKYCEVCRQEIADAEWEDVRDEYLDLDYAEYLDDEYGGNAHTEYEPPDESYKLRPDWPMIEALAVVNAAGRCEWYIGGDCAGHGGRLH